MGFREFSLLCCSVPFFDLSSGVQGLPFREFRQERENSHNIGFEVYGMETKRKTTIQALGYREWKEMETTIRGLGVEKLK